MKRIIAKTLNAFEQACVILPQDEQKPERRELFLRTIYPLMTTLKKMQLVMLNKKEIEVLREEMSLMKKVHPKAVRFFTEVLGFNELSLKQIEERYETLCRILDKLEDTEILVGIEEMSGAI